VFYIRRHLELLKRVFQSKIPKLTAWIVSPISLYRRVRGSHLRRNNWLFHCREWFLYIDLRYPVHVRVHGWLGSHRSYRSDCSWWHDLAWFALATSTVSRCLREWFLTSFRDPRSRYQWYWRWLLRERHLICRLTRRESRGRDSCRGLSHRRISLPIEHLASFSCFDQTASTRAILRQMLL
jgi:hypothetical protein